MFDYNAETGSIRMYGVIGDEITDTDLMNALDDMGGRDVTINLQSEGGSVIDGLSMANQIAAYPGKVTVAIDSLAASIATVFPMRADYVTANANATVMIHRAWAFAAGNAKELRMTAGVLDKLDQTIAGMYAEKAGTKSTLEFSEMMDKETYFTADEAMAIGLVDEVIEGGKAPKNRTPLATIRNDARLSEMLETMGFDPVAICRPRAASVSTWLQSKKLKLH